MSAGFVIDNVGGEALHVDYGLLSQRLQHLASYLRLGIDHEPLEAVESICDQREPPTATLLVCFPAILTHHRPSPCAVGIDLNFEDTKIIVPLKKRSSSKGRSSGTQDIGCQACPESIMESAANICLLDEV